MNATNSDATCLFSFAPKLLQVSLSIPCELAKIQQGKRAWWVHSYIDEKANTTLNNRERFYLITENEIWSRALKNVMIAYELMYRL